jgi:hypothetical protein
VTFVLQESRKKVRRDRAAKDNFMAKALVGYMNTMDPRVVAGLTAENRRLRQRVADLEAQLMRLQAENDTLVAAAEQQTLRTVREMQPV